jgi:2-dehydropantoate 2-reductase
MRVSVLGAGAIGSMLGGLIKHRFPETEVLFVGRGAHGQAIHERGCVQLRGPWGRCDVPVAFSEDIAEIADSDFVLVTVKSQDTQAALEQASTHCGRAIVVSIQNGINDGTLLRFVSPDRLVMGMTATNISVVEPGVVSLQLNGVTVVGPSRDRANLDASRSAARLLAKSGLPVREHPDVLGVLYSKLTFNAVGYASCLSRSNFITEGLCDRAWRTHVGLPLVKECIATLRRAQIPLAKIPGRPGIEGLRNLLLLLGVPLLGKLIATVARRNYNRKAIVFSLQQDLVRGKPTEIDHVNGQVVRLAESHAGQAPFNSAVVAMVHELEQQGADAFFSREQVMERFQRLGQAAGHPMKAEP